MEVLLELFKINPNLSKDFLDKLLEELSIEQKRYWQEQMSIPLDSSSNYRGIVINQQDRIKTAFYNIINS